MTVCLEVVFVHVGVVRNEGEFVGLDLHEVFLVFEGSVFLGVHSVLRLVLLIPVEEKVLRLAGVDVELGVHRLVSLGLLGLPEGVFVQEEVVVLLLEHNLLIIYLLH